MSIFNAISTISAKTIAQYPACATKAPLYLLSKIFDKKHHFSEAILCFYPMCKIDGLDYVAGAEILREISASLNS
ncbi:MAG: hypothetical protein H7069_05075 [Phormidesmis sp. FL-bin-119]|nr:hypothetical protein [Pedobacter sp.]